MTPWSKQEVEEFIQWHKQRLYELKYPPEVVSFLERDRDVYLSKTKRVS